MTLVNNLEGYNIVLTSPAKKALLKIETHDAYKIKTKLKALVSGSQSIDVKKLTDYKQPTYRLRVGNYRVLYEVYKQTIVIKVIRISHRKNVYKF